MPNPYPVGKLPAEHLARLLARYAPTDESVLVGPGVGHDAAVISFGDRCLVAKTDPITFASDQIGWYAVQVNANDVACTGAACRWFLATLLLPEDRTGPSLVDTVFAQMAEACDDLGIQVVGGHTEITHGIDRPIVIGCMLGEVERGRLVRPDGARPGDALLLTKGVAIEGTAIIARENVAEMEDVEAGLVDRCRAFLYSPGISVVKDAAIACSAGEVHAMHDPTEGGLATGLWELAEAARAGLVVYEEAIPVFEETRLLCERLAVDPLGLIASGALLMAARAGDADAILDALRRGGIEAARIGEVTERRRGLIIRGADGERPLPRFDRDELARLFY
jgi:hydrogenase expression/formation protein HypE